MKTQLFYFSGTGNSLRVAKDLAAILGDTEVVSIPKAMKNPEKPRLAVQGPPAPRIAPSELPRGANPKPWMDRRVRECAWPVEGEGTAVLSCCAPVTVRKDGQFHSYCAAHLLLGTVRTISKPRAPYEPNVIRVPARVR